MSLLFDTARYTKLYYQFSFIVSWISKIVSYRVRIPQNEINTGINATGTDRLFLSKVYF